ncbi:hypothetical protein KR009_005757, partial [Drosophila setifemur]
VLLLVLVLWADSSLGARRLRKKPKVYNALITTDDNLTSSRAYPVIQPTIHEPGYAPFGPYNPFGYYSPPVVRFGQPIVPGLSPNERLPYPLPTAAQYPSGYAPYEQQQPVEAPVEQQPQAAPGSLEPKEMPKEQMPLPLPLNEQGLPPVLIPLPSQYRGQPSHLPPYPYNQYPVIYDQAGYIRQNYLPPYDYYPSQGYPYRAAADAQPPPAPQDQQKIQPEIQQQIQPEIQQQIPPEIQSQMQPETQPQSQSEIQPLSLDNLEPVRPSFADIRNGSESKNSAVPDVPPPPIPSGPKRPRPANTE